MDDKIALEILRRNSEALRANVKHANTLDPEGGMHTIYNMLDLITATMLNHCKDCCNASDEAAVECFVSAIGRLINEHASGSVIVTEGTLPEILEKLKGLDDAEDETKH